MILTVRCALLTGAFLLIAGSASAADPGREACMAAVDQARTGASALPKGDLSRYFAERELQQALTEAGNGEFDDCLEWAARAMEEVRALHHHLAPGETLKLRNADPIGTPAPP